VKPQAAERFGRALRAGDGFRASGSGVRLIARRGDDLGRLRRLAMSPEPASGGAYERAAALKETSAIVTKAL